MTEHHKNESVPARRRCVIVGLGARAEMFTEALSSTYADQIELVGFCDTNATRMKAHNDLMAKRHGSEPAPCFGADEFDTILSDLAVDLVIVVTIDRTHDDYIVRALEAGCDVITEKPMTTDADRARRILEAERKSSGSIRVAFNYRYNPVHVKLREVLASGVIGEIGSVHFEWLLDVKHGADYFRRWHRDKANSGGLMVHKATHHFDLVNWWIGSAPRTVFGLGKLFFYGDENGQARGLARSYDRALNSAEAAEDPFALNLNASPLLKALYVDAEHEDGYHRDMNVFAPGITIEDDMAVMVAYESGATMTYHLTAYSPWEGYRVAFNGSKGRVELLVEETVWAKPETTASDSAVVHDGVSIQGRISLTVHPLWEPPYVVEVEIGEGGHGGGDNRMLADLFAPSGAADQHGRAANSTDGARSLIVGLAANRSFETGQAVAAKDILDIP